MLNVLPKVKTPAHRNLVLCCVATMIYGVVVMLRCSRLANALMHGFFLITFPASILLGVRHGNLAWDEGALYFTAGMFFIAAFLSWLNLSVVSVLTSPLLVVPLVAASVLKDPRATFVVTLCCVSSLHTQFQSATKLGDASEALLASVFNMVVAILIGQQERRVNSVSEVICLNAVRPTMIMRMDTQQPVCVNTAFMDLTGWTLADVQALPREDILSTGWGFLNSLQDCVEGLYADLKGAKGEAFPVMIVATRVLDEEGLQVGDIAITFIKAADEQSLHRKVQMSEARLRASSGFLATMSFELRNRLNGVLGMAQVIENVGSKLGSHERSCIQTIQTTTLRILSVVNDLLDLARLEEGNAVFTSVQTELRTLVVEVVEVTQRVASAKHLEIIACFPEGVDLSISCDPSRVRQVLLHLLHNGVRYTQAGGVRLSITVESESSRSIELKFEVSDTGKGMSPLQERHLFLRFHEHIPHRFTDFEEADTVASGGTGLGLAISQAVVAHMGGTMGVASRQEKGCTVWFKVKFLKSAPGFFDSVSSSWPSVKHNLGRLEVSRALLAFSSQYLLFAMQDEIGALDIEVHGVLSTHTALAEAQQHVFDVVFVDYELLRDKISQSLSFFTYCLRQIQPSTLIVICANDSEVEKQQEDLGFVVLTKPMYKEKVASFLLQHFGDSNDDAMPDLCKPSHPLVSIASEHAEVPVALAPRKKSSKKGKGKKVRRSLDEIPQKLSPFRILICEDSEVNQKVTKMLLTSAGFEVDIASNGIEALEFTETICYQVVLMDIRMPNMNGLEATKIIRARQRPGDREMYIFLLTACDLAEKDKQKLTASGINGILAKPILKEDLLHAIKTAQDALALKVPRGEGAQASSATT